MERQMRASGVGASGGDGGLPELADEMRACRCKEMGQRGDRVQGGDGGLALGRKRGCEGDEGGGRRAAGSGLADRRGDGAT